MGPLVAKWDHRRDGTRIFEGSAQLFFFFFCAADVSHCIFCAGALIVAAIWRPPAGLRLGSEHTAPIFVFIATFFEAQK